VYATIAAIATGPGAGGIGIVRLSGPRALAAARRVCALPGAVPARRALLVPFVVGGAPVDEGLVLRFAAPASYTGEEVVELHAHGGQRLLSLLLEGVLEEDEVRLAEPGEFTRRALLSGRLDLARAEAVADLIAAESRAQVEAAAAQLAGGLSARVEVASAAVLAALAEVEGILEFPEEAAGTEAGVPALLAAAGREVRELLADGARGALIRRGARVVLYGPVNAGKSTLFNRLVGAERALVDEEPGTTRDALEARLELGGLAVTLVDTAGLREGPGRLESLGIERTRAALSGADLAVLVTPPDAGPASRAGWASEVESGRRLEVLGKADLPGGATQALRVSGLTGEGLPALRAALAARLGAGVAGSAAVTSERHLACLRRASEALRQAEEALVVSTLEVVGAELQLAQVALGELTGREVSIELLDAVFARFCVGK
jgi:tRNA modification GTPase